MSIYEKSYAAGALMKPVRNRYFHGKKLEVRHFEIEQEYFNAKRWLLNRMVAGFGVVCGLDVVPYEKNAVVVKSGLAIDKWGREIIVAKDSMPITIAPPETVKPEKKNHLHLCLEYLECEAEPVPALEGECQAEPRCMPDSIHERYRIVKQPGPAPKFESRCGIPDLTNDNTGEIDYAVMVKWVSEKCPVRSDDPCIPLAELKFDEYGKCVHIDITVRQIVYTNDLIYEMIMAMTEPDRSPTRGGSDNRMKGKRE